MKRFIIIMLMILLTVMLIPVQTYAYSESQLDVPITDLNNHTLREVFEDGNLFMAPLTLQNLALVGGIYVEQGQTNLVRIYKTGQTIVGNTYYITGEVKRSIGGGNNVYVGSQFTPLINSTANTWLKITGQLIPTDTTSISFYSQNVVPLSGETFEYKNLFAVNQTSLGIDTLTVSQMDYWYSVYVFNKEHEVIVTNEGLGSDLMNLLKGFINTLISLFDYMMYTKVTILGIEFSFLGLIGSGLIILILAFQIIWLVI